MAMFIDGFFFFFLLLNLPAILLHPHPLLSNNACFEKLPLDGIHCGIQNGDGPPHFLFPV